MVWIQLLLDNRRQRILTITISKCPRFVGHRIDTFHQYSGPDLLEGQWDIQDVLEFSRINVIADAIESYGNMFWSEYMDRMRDQDNDTSFDI